MRRLLLILATLSLLVVACGAGSDSRTAGASSNSNSQTSSAAPAKAYALVAWSELGMHCIDGKDYSIFAILPPYNVIHAQLIKKAEPPVPITSGVTITYQATPDTTKSVNTSSASKTNFWSWAQLLFLASPPPETGLAGYKTQSKTPQPMTYNTTEGYWEGVGIPTVPYDDQSKFNPLPMAKLVAKDTAGNVARDCQHRALGERRDQLQHLPRLQQRSGGEAGKRMGEQLGSGERCETQHPEEA